MFQIVIKKREPLNFSIPDGSTGFSSRLAATQDMPFIHQSVSMPMRARESFHRFFPSFFFKKRKILKELNKFKTLSKALSI